MVYHERVNGMLTVFLGKNKKKNKKIVCKLLPENYIKVDKVKIIFVTKSIFFTFFFSLQLQGQAKPQVLLML